MATPGEGPGGLVDGSAAGAMPDDCVPRPVRPARAHESPLLPPVDDLDLRFYLLVLTLAPLSLAAVPAPQPSPTSSRATATTSIAGDGFSPDPDEFAVQLPIR